MVSTSHPLIEHYARRDDDVWELRAYGPGETAHLGDLGLGLAVDVLYDTPLDVT